MKNYAGGGKLVFKSLFGAIFWGSSLLGSAFADDFINNSQDSIYTDNVILEAADNFDNSGSIKNTKIEITGGRFINTGDINTEILDVYTINGGESPKFDGVITATDTLIYRGAGGNVYPNLNSITTTPLLQIIGMPSGQTGLTVTDNKYINGIDSFYIESNGGRTGIFIDKNVHATINSLILKDNIEKGQDSRVEIYDEASVNINSLDVQKGKGVLQVDDNSSFTVDNIVIDKNSKLSLLSYSDKNYENNHGTFALNNLSLKEGAKIQVGLNGGVDGTATATSMPITIKGNITVDLAKDAGVDFGGYKDLKNQDWRPESITFAADSLTVNVADSRSDSFVYLSGYEDENGKKLKTKVENIKLIAAANNNTGDAEADLTALANIIKTNTKEGEDRVNTLRCLPGVLLEQKPTDIFDGSTAIIADSDDCENCTIKDVKIEKVQTQENPNINGIAEMAALGLHVWRNEIDEMHRRVGELRDSSESIDGVWARVNNGQARYGNQDIKNNYTSVQVGYDRQVSPGVWVGGALSYTDGDNDFRYGDGETDLYAFSLYNSWLFDNGIYLDLVGKIGRMKNSFDIQYDAVDSSGDYHTNAVSLSAELGWRYYATESLFVEPQAEMWYGHVFDADYRTSTGIDVDNKSVDSLVGRLGLKLGFDFPDELGSFFVKASVLHDWEGDADFSFRKGDIERSLTESLGGTWYEYGFGADFNPTDKVHLYADIEAGNGGEVDTDYRFNLGARYAF